MIGFFTADKGKRRPIGMDVEIIAKPLVREQ